MKQTVDVIQKQTQETSQTLQDAVNKMSEKLSSDSKVACLSILRVVVEREYRNYLSVNLIKFG